MQGDADTSGTAHIAQCPLSAKGDVAPRRGPYEPDVADPSADLFLLLSTADPAADRPAVELQLVTAHVDHELPVVSSAGLIELSGNDDAKTRGLAFIHRDKEKMSVSETEDGDFGGVVKLDRRQIAKVRWDVKPQIFGLQIGAGDRLQARCDRRADRFEQREGAHQ
jgi:hypothetical protein